MKRYMKVDFWYFRGFLGVSAEGNYNHKYIKRMIEDRILNGVVKQFAACTTRRKTAVGVKATLWEAKQKEFE